MIEIKAAVGLLILSGVMCSRRESMEQLWSERYGRPLFRATMALKRFKVFLVCARFDDKVSRLERQANDKLAPIRFLFDNFVQKCKTLYIMSPYVCVDESLLGFRGRCSFRVYMPSKPARYGLKVWMLCDSSTNFAGNMQVYLGKEPHGVEKQQGARVVKDLSSYLNGTGRNITTDNFFTSYALATISTYSKPDNSWNGEEESYRNSSKIVAIKTKRIWIYICFHKGYNDGIVRTKKLNKTVVLMSTPPW